MKKKLLFALAALLASMSAAVAQVTRVAGIVVAEDDGEPVVGAYVRVKGTDFGALTDIDGRFEIKNITGNHKTILATCIGMQPTQVALKANVRIVMPSGVTEMQEQIVTAFGKQTRESFTGSAGVLKTEKIAERQTTGVLAALNGQIAGVQMAEGNGPNGSPTIRIRGISSINAGSSPLIIVDGLPYNGYYNDINPADVESVSVLKDAAANSLYGARGANGVILITTKSAKKGTKPIISAEARWGFNHDAKVDYDRINDPGQYYEMHYRALYNYFVANGQTPYEAHISANNTIPKSETEGGLVYQVYNVPEGQTLIGDNGRLNPAATLGRVYNYAGQDYMLLPDDWKKEGIRDGFRQEYNVSVNGSTGDATIYFGLGYLGNEGLTYGSQYDRYSGRLKMDYQVRPWLKVGANVNYTHHDSDSQTGAFSAAHNISPIYPLYIRDGLGNILTDRNGLVYDWGNGLVNGLVRPVHKNGNPLQDDRLDRSSVSSNAFGAAAFADVTFLKDFRFTTNINIHDTEAQSISTVNPYYGYYVSMGGYITKTQSRTFTLNTQQLLNWTHSFGKHTTSVLLGHEYTHQMSGSVWGRKTKVLAYDANQSLAGSLTVDDTDDSGGWYNVQGFFVRGLYDYDNKYFGSFSVRRDGTSHFARSHRWGNFWSFGAAWILTKENWFNVPKVDMLKLKASVGQQGNDNLGSSYYYTNYYEFQTVNGEGAASFSWKGSKTITWETNTNVNTGFEFELLKNRIAGSLEYYRRKTSDMLLWFTAPRSVGYGGYYDNVGDLVNQGVELDLTITPIRTKKVHWDVRFNLSHNHNEITYIPTEKKQTTINGYSGYTSGYRFYGEGLPINTWYMPKYMGVNENGEPLWLLVTSEGEETTTSYSSASFQICGDPNPKVYGGFGTTLGAYGFDLSANFLYSLGGDVLDNGYMTLMSSPYTSATGMPLHKDLLNAWSQTNPDSDIPRFQYGDTESSATSSRFLTNGRVFTFKNVSVGYTLPKRLTEKAHISQLRLYVSCDNVGYWSARKGLDPRTSLSGNASATAYSPMRVLSGGISLKF